MPANVRQHVYYSGRVQGVGFRYTAVRCAGAYEVSGFVRNLDDGRVELVVEGPRKDVDGLLEDIRNTMARNIRNESSQTEEATGEYHDFSVQH